MSRNSYAATALGLHGIEAVMTGKEATDAAGFHADVAQGLGPTRRPGDIVVWAHLSAPTTTAIQLYRAMLMTLWLPQAEAALAQVEGR